ncbi:MAG: GNAT family N-acetyltransferase [Verrucomicrobia bacterium]|nr:GNAT family N-acetyltransferase [Verrucomicrobiota bacterium]
MDDAPNNALKLRRMTSADLPFADALRAKIGWNQTLQDWERLLALEPEGCFVAEWDGAPAGTATTTSYGKNLAWIGMVLVAPDRRRCGIGKALLMHCLEYLKHAGIRCIKLDATPLGKTLYDRLGFRDEWTLARWDGVVNPGRVARENANRRSSRPRVRPVEPRDWPHLLKLDADAFGVMRGRILERLVQNSLRFLICEDETRAIWGYGMMRRGSSADYLGPVVCHSSACASVLTAALLDGLEDRSVFWDIPDQAKDAVEFATRLGFARQRLLIRMYLGENSCVGNPSRLIAIADPAMG